MYQFILPVAALAYDFDLKRVSLRSEFKSVIVIKMLAWIFYYALYTVTKLKKTSTLYMIMNFGLLGFPCLAAFYTVLIIKFK